LALVSACRAFEFSCSDFLKGVAPHSRGARSARGSCRPTSNKIEFNRLNGNLMVPKIRPPTLTFNSNFHNGVKAETSFEFWVSMMGLMTT
jgi:hypothetical protein